LLTSSSNQSLLNISSASSTSLTELSKSKLGADTSLYANSTLLHPKYKIKRDDYYRLLCQSLKCFSLNISTMSIDHSIDDSFDMSNCSHLSFHNDSTMTHVSASSKIHHSDPWSVDTLAINVHNVRPEANLQVYAHKLVLRNHSGTKVQLKLIYKQNFLELQPIGDSITLRPYDKCELRVMPRKEVLSKLPWHGLLMISCNSCKKDIKVS
jgi:hypothetical protein